MKKFSYNWIHFFGRFMKVSRENWNWESIRENKKNESNTQLSNRHSNISVFCFCAEQKNLNSFIMPLNIAHIHEKLSLSSYYFSIFFCEFSSSSSFPFLSSNCGSLKRIENFFASTKRNFFAVLTATFFWFLFSKKKTTDWVR